MARHGLTPSRQRKKECPHRYNIQRYIRLHDRQEHVYEKEKQDEVFLLAEGIIDGKVVATHEVRPARRPEKLLLWVDNENTDLKADGSDFVTVVAAIADKTGISNV